jgi:hypothetical protein
MQVIVILIGIIEEWRQVKVCQDWIQKKVEERFLTAKGSCLKNREAVYRWQEEAGSEKNPDLAPMADSSDSPMGSDSPSA